MISPSSMEYFNTYMLEVRCYYRLDYNFQLYIYVLLLVHTIGIAPEFLESIPRQILAPFV